jgi:hypothetical protein
MSSSRPLKNPNLIFLLENATEGIGAVPKGFVKSFFNMVDFDTATNDMTVDLEDARVWLKIDRIDVLKRILVND